MMLVGSWNVELDFRVLAPTSIYGFYFAETNNSARLDPLRIIYLNKKRNRVYHKGRDIYSDYT